MFTKFSAHKFALSFLALLIFILSACAPITPMPQSGAQPTQPVTTAAPPATPVPTAVFAGLDPEAILLQLTYEPGFSLPQYRFEFGRTPYFTLLADGRVIYVDETQDSKVMMAQLSQAEASTLLQKVDDLGFARLESHTDMCGTLADGSESCIADAATSVMRVRMQDGSLREIRNYAHFSNGPATYEAIYNLLNDYTHPGATLYLPQAATLFVQIVPQPEMSSPAGWPLDPAYVQRAQAASDQFTAVVLSAEEAAKWQQEVGVDGSSVTFQLNGQPVLGTFVPWMPGEDYTTEIAAQFPG